MDRNRGVLFLADPMNGNSAAQMKSEYTNSITLIFDENGRYLSLAQEALWQIRQRVSWVCVVAEGQAACIAVALAAQLPVERLVLRGNGLFFLHRNDLPRELARLVIYARRNLSLVVSEIMLIGAGKAEVRGFLRGRNRGKICALEEDKEEESRDLLTAPWEQVCRNNLLIPWKCV